MAEPGASQLVTAARWFVRYAPGSLGKPTVATWLNDCLRADTRSRVVRTRWGGQIEVTTGDLIQRFLYEFGEWEPHMTRWLRERLCPGDVFVDVGANIGYMSLLGSRLVGPTGSVVAIEASAGFHRKLQWNAALNGCVNLRTVNSAVSDEPKTLRFVLASSSNRGALSAVPYEGAAEETFETDAKPLPDLLRSDEIERARVIKIDVEGAEGAVIRGLAPVLPCLRRDAEITVEVTPERMAKLGDSVEELLEIMRRHGYHLYRMPNSYAPTSYPAAIRRPHPPVRWRDPLPREGDFVFSHMDTETLR